MAQFFKHTYKFLFLLVISFMLIGCGSLKKDDQETEFDSFLDDPDYYKPGDSVRGGDFSFLDVQVDGYIWDATKSEIVELEDGSYVEPGTHQLFVHTTPRRDPSLLSSEYGGLADLLQGDPLDQRVYLSDGGNEYLVEAYMDETTGLYTCDLNVDGTYSIYTLLIEVIYRDGMAAKEKIILNTRKNVRAPVNKLVKEGAAISLNTDFIMDIAKWGVQQDRETTLYPVIDLLNNAILCELQVMDFAKRIAEIDWLLDTAAPFLLEWGDITPGENSFVDIHLENRKGLATVGLSVEDIYEDGDVIEGAMPIEIPVSVVGLDLEFVDRIVQWVASWFISLMSEPLSLNLDDILNPIADDLFAVLLDLADLPIEFANQMAAELLNALLPTNMTLFVNAVVEPEQNTDKMAVGFGGLLLADSRKLPTGEELARDGICFPPWPENTIVDASVPLDVTPIMNENFDIGVAVGGYEVNSLVGQLGDIYEVVLPPTIVNIALGMLANLKEANYSELVGKCKFNPNGITFEFHDSDGKATGVVMANDVTLTLEADGAPVTIMNVDVVFEFELGFRWENGQWFVDLGLTVVPEMSKMHLFNDKLGLTFLDHSSIIKAIIDVLFFAEAFGDYNPQILLPINITELLGVCPKEENTTIFCKNNNLYLSLCLDHENPVNWPVLNKWLSAAFQY